MVAGRATPVLGGALASGVLLVAVSCGDGQQAGRPPSGADGGDAGSVGASAGSSHASAGTSNVAGATGGATDGGGAPPSSAAGAPQGGTRAEGGAENDGGWGGEGNSGGWGDCLVGVPADAEQAGAAGAGGAATLLGEVGTDCEPWGSLACAGANQQQNLVCKLGKWEPLLTCAAGESCDQTSGRCEAILPACLDQEPGFLYCEGDRLEVCGPDRVSVTALQCCGVCSEGQCRAPRCGDGHTSFGEVCDDGNRRNGDGCDSDCRPSDVVQLVGGQHHTCALLRRGQARCWGGNESGQLGLGDSEDHSGQHPFELGLVELGGPVEELVAGSRHTCARLRDGGVRCWGANEHGQLGLGHVKTIGDDEIPSAQHATVALGAPAIRLASGGESTCAILTGGGLRCWGRNDWGQLGVDVDEDIGDDELPSSHAVSLGQQTAVAIAASGEHLCAALDDGTFRCWGYNEYEQLDFMSQWELEDGGVTNMWGSGFRTYTLLSWDQGDFLFAAGFNLDGLLGVGGPSPAQAPSDAASLRTLHATLEVAVSPTHVCYLQADQTTHCFGLNDAGQLGLPDTTDRYRPSVVDLGVDDAKNPVWAQRVGAGGAHTCVWLGTRELRCWGQNDRGQLGLGYASPAPLDHVGGSESDNAATAIAVRLFGSE